MFACDVLRFSPLVTSMGSANWTEASRGHVEHGIWSTGPALVVNNYDYLCSLIVLSENFGSASPEPTPEFVAAVWDDDAFKEHFAEYRYNGADGVMFDVTPVYWPRGGPRQESRRPGQGVFAANPKPFRGNGPRTRMGGQSTTKTWERQP